MQEEMLIPYDAVMPDDPRRVVSHVYDVAGVKEIVSSPSLLESTTVVFAYGLDLFGTRVAPSRTFDVLSPNFNKVRFLSFISSALAMLMRLGMVVGAARVDTGSAHGGHCIRQADGEEEEAQGEVVCKRIDVL